MDWLDLARDSKMRNGRGGAWTRLNWLGTVKSTSIFLRVHNKTNSAL
jgi:hypothetical protein